MRNYTPKPINRIIDQRETLRKLTEIAKVVKIKPLCKLMNIPYSTLSKLRNEKRRGLAVKTKMMVDIMYEVFQSMKNNAESKQETITVLRRDKHYG